MHAPRKHACINNVVDAYIHGKAPQLASAVVASFN